MTAKKKKKGGGIFWKLLFLVALCVFCFSMYQLVNIYLGYKKGVDEYHAVAEATTVQSSEPLEVVEEKKDEEGNLIPEEELTVNPPEVDFDALKAINDDVVGWLELEAIPSISYPIAQGEDNEYYLHRTIKKTYNFAGSVFIDSTNASDFSDCNTIIYGHNMKNGSMFGKLKQMYESEKYKDSKYLWICTPNGKYRYEIFSMQYAKVGSDVYTLFSAHDEQFEAYVKKMAKQSKVDMKALGERTINIDCDVLQADGGTRTASITGAYVALVDAMRWAEQKRHIRSADRVLKDAVSAVSVGVINGTPMLDLPYIEDSQAMTDMNVAMTGSGDFIEIQGTAEHRPFNRAELNTLLDLAEKGNKELQAAQRAALSLD